MIFNYLRNRFKCNSLKKDKNEYFSMDIKNAITFKSNNLFIYIKT